MSPRRSRLVPVLLAAVLLVGAANLGAYAATGDPLLLGKGNKASKTTKIKTTGNGAALSLKSKAGKAPLAVSNATKITKLNADLVDGLDGDALRTTAYRYALTGTSASGILRFEFPGLPPGQYVASLAVNATIPGSTHFACMFDRGVVFGNGQIAVIGAKSPDADNWYASGSGLLDTAANAYTLTCSGSTADITVPGPFVPAHVLFTRVDSLTPLASVGTSP